MGMPPTTVPGVQRVVMSRTADVSMGAKKGLFNFGQPASPTKPVVGGKTNKPLSPGSNYPTTKNIQTQGNGFGTFLQKFQTVSGKSKYGMPIFLPNGNVNPAYLAAERKDQAAVKAKNIKATGAKVKKLISKKELSFPTTSARRSARSAPARTTTSRAARCRRALVRLT